jgi:hypothetical protein
MRRFAFVRGFRVITLVTPERTALEGAGSGSRRSFKVSSPHATALENNEKLRLLEQAGNEFAGSYGGGDGPE